MGYIVAQRHLLVECADFLLCSVTEVLQSDFSLHLPLMELVSWSYS